MPELSLETPIILEQAAHQVSDPGLMTVAAFLLAAGTWGRGYELSGSILPSDDLRQLGLFGWQLMDGLPPERLNPYQSEFLDPEWERPDRFDSTAFHTRLGELIWRAYTSRRSYDLARAVLFGTNSPDALVRVCALTSAFELFNFFFNDRVLKLARFDFSRDETSSVIAQMLMAQTFRISISSSGASPPPTGSQNEPSGLMLIHGTNFPPSRPIWSVPGVGPLFNHIAVFRKDTYSSPDYFRWEGGYSDYAREVASLNLNDWIHRRRLSGIDAVTHSHGGNVLIAATNLGVDFGKVVFLSCPVRWNRYRPRMGSIKKAQSVRIHFDFVILADRSAQRFPPNTIPEDVLPRWFVNHSATTEPNTWKSQALDKYLQ